MKSITDHFDVVVVGCGMAGLSAALSAAEKGAAVAVLDRAPHGEHGGNTRYTEAFLRMKNEGEIAEDFEEHLIENAGGHLDPTLVAMTSSDRASWPSVLKAMSFADPELVSTFAGSVVPTISWLKSFSIRFDSLPTAHLTRNMPRTMPIGGGLAMIEALEAGAKKHDITFFYETTAVDLIQAQDGAVVGVLAAGKRNKRTQIRGDAVVLASGGFEGNTEMLTRYLGPRALNLRPFAQGGHFNKGEGIEMALRIGAAPCGEYGNYHASPMDPRSGRPAPSVYIFPYGILVNGHGRRFVDEAPGTVDETYELICRQILDQPESIAYAVLDAKLTDIPNYQRSLRTDQPAITSPTLKGLASKIGVPEAALEETVTQFNRACTKGRFSPFELDSLCTTSLTPPKSNFARPIEQPPFHAYPIISSNVFTFGGLKVNSQARVLNRDGEEIPGLYAAGETVGIYYKSYTGATSVLKAAVFGRIAGLDAVHASAEERSVTSATN